MIVTLQTLVFFRQSLLSVVERLISPYYNKLALPFTRQTQEDEDIDEEEVYAEFDDKRGVVFYPPMYAQRYAAVTDCLMDERWAGKLEKVVDFGYHDMSYIKYLMEVQGIRVILGVDIETIPLRCSSSLLSGDAYTSMRENPLQLTLFQGNAADPDYRLIGCDAVVAIEMIEHMLPHDLDRLLHTVFGFIKPWVAVFTTPNADFNVLFKNMEKNGLRRCDHFFEWTREQFYDWCSNIVVRYPQFTVSCKGVGPGPPGTHHHGCCSQLALFVNKDYHKQPDLDINSLALVRKFPSPNNLVDLDEWSSNMDVKTSGDTIQAENGTISHTLSAMEQSCMAIAFSNFIDNLEYCDKESQCNLEIEDGKNFLMFNEEDMCVTTLIPRRKMENIVYEIEDVNSRLNCTVCSVTKFSKQSQNLMAKNKNDNLVHTREVVSEIQHLKKMLNYKELPATDGKSIWCNINWGDNAPYWNQYYRIVRDYSYPFQPKSEECRILDLISEEINQLVDMQTDNQLATNADKIEIPIEHLMEVVKHITDDKFRVKDLLEWNGYEIEGDMVIHSRLVVDRISLESRDEPEDSESDLDTEFRSTTVSDWSNVDYLPGRSLRRALDKKVQALRAMLTADEDISIELDRVVCRLMKLALFTSRAKQTPPPTKWLQCKLLDLLTLTEKAIARRQQYHLEHYPLNAIQQSDGQVVDFTVLNKYKEDSLNVLNIVDKYSSILDCGKFLEQTDFDQYKYEYEDMADASNETLKDFVFSDSNFFISGNTDSADFVPKTKTSEADFSTDYSTIVDDEGTESCATSKILTPSSLENINSNAELCKHKIPRKEQGTHEKNTTNYDRKSRKRQHSKVKRDNRNESITNLKNIRNKSSSNSFVRSRRQTKFIPRDYENGNKLKRKVKLHQNLQSTASKPVRIVRLIQPTHFRNLTTDVLQIPGSLIELCHPELTQDNAMINNPLNHKRECTHTGDDVTGKVVANDESVFMGILMDNRDENTVLNRLTGSEVEATTTEKEVLLGQLFNETKDVALGCELRDMTENHSQTIFIYDINEPSTSKGIRHISMDVQCGPDSVTPSNPRPSPVTSLTKLPQFIEIGVKIESSITNLNSKKFNNGPCNVIKNFGPTSLRIRSAGRARGIKIVDSSTSILANQKVSNFGTSTNNDQNEEMSTLTRFVSPTRRYVGIKIKDSTSDIRKDSGVGASLDENHNICTSCQRAKSPTKHIKETSFRESYTDMCTPKDTQEIEMTYNEVQCVYDDKQKIICFESSVRTSYTNTAIETGTSTENESTHDITTSKQRHNIQVPCHKVQFVSNNVSSNSFTQTSDAKSEDTFDDFSASKKSFGFKVKSDDGTITKSYEYSVTRVEISDFHTRFLDPTHPSSTTESKITDFGSEFCELNSPPKSTVHLTNLSHCDSPAKVPILEKEVKSKNLRNKLSCGGVHVHSYKDKQLSEDIVYQGEWQKHSFRLKKKLPEGTDSGISKDSYKKTKSSEQKTKFLKLKQNKVQINTEVEKTTEIRARLQKVKQDFSGAELVKRRPSTNFVKTITNKNVTKVSSKVAMSSVVSKNARNALRNARVTNKQDVAFGRGRCTLQQTKLKTGPDKNLTKPRIPLKPKRKINMDKTNFSLETKDMEVSKENLNVSLPTLAKTHTEDFIKINNDARENLTYVVFRNELENNQKLTTNNEPTENSNKTGSSSRKRTLNRRSSSPISQTSSAYSSTDSVVTVKETRSKPSRRICAHSPSSNKDVISDNDTARTNRKYVRKYKNLKKSEENEKENVPETSDKLIINDENLQMIKGAFVGRGKNVYLTQVPNDSALTLNSRHQISNKSNFQKLDSSDEKKRTGNSTIIIKRSIIQDSLNTSDEILDKTPSNVVYVLGVPLDNIENNQPTATINYCNSSENNISSDMKQIVEDHLNFALSPPHQQESNNAEYSKREETSELELDESSSLKSFKTVIMKDDTGDSSFFTETTFNNTFESAQGTIASTDCNQNKSADTDLDSVKAFHSLGSSTRLFQDAHDKTYDIPLKIHHSNSVRDIFERKEQLVPKTAGMLAVQAFSGFSMDAEPVSGDQSNYINPVQFDAGPTVEFTRQAAPCGEPIAKLTPDPINAVDSETGSIASGIIRPNKIGKSDVNRCTSHLPDPVNLVDSETGSIMCSLNQNTSEELFVSGRSSPSYESCIIDEDAVVPNWLFNIISQQYQTDTEDEQPSREDRRISLPSPPYEPVADMNGNTVEQGMGVGAGAGAGDGRGMHSDHSQDSSGRGTSLSSSATSSDEQSEAILIDPSAFTAQFELLRDSSIASSAGVTALVLPINARPEGADNLILSTSRDPGRIPMSATTASDGDADVSSIDTDVPDSTEI